MTHSVKLVSVATAVPPYILEQRRGGDNICLGQEVEPESDRADFDCDQKHNAAGARLREARSDREAGDTAGAGMGPRPACYGPTKRALQPSRWRANTPGPRAAAKARCAPIKPQIYCGKELSNYYKRLLLAGR
jgi:hypothetical protein